MQQLQGWERMKSIMGNLALPALRQRQPFIAQYRPHAELGCFLGFHCPRVPCLACLDRHGALVGSALDHAVPPLPGPDFRLVRPGPDGVLRVDRMIFDVHSVPKWPSGAVCGAGIEFAKGIEGIIEFNWK